MPWLTQIAASLESAADSIPKSPVWQEPAVKLAKAVGKNREALEAAGADVERVLAALRPLLGEGD